MNEEIDNDQGIDTGNEIEENNQEDLENYEPLDEDNYDESIIKNNFEPRDESKEIKRKCEKNLICKANFVEEMELDQLLKEKNTFNITVFFDPKLLDVYNEYFKERNQKVNIGVKIRPDFFDFIRNSTNLNSEQKRELIEKVGIINRRKLIDKYLIHKLSTTNETITHIAKIPEINGLWIDHHYVRNKEKELDINNRRVLRVNVAHPNLNEKCFEVIDTKEKGYWLGVMFSDGSTYIEKNTNSKRVELKVNLKDEQLINNFIKFTKANLDKKYHIDNSVRIRIVDKKMFNNLVKHGCIPNKSLKIKFPELPNREIKLSFLLGCFDGDGTEGTSRLTSGSREFLEEIKNIFDIKHNVTQDYEDKNAYRLSLGVSLFNEMLDNYENSLHRKRVYLTSNDESIKLALEKAKLAKKSQRLDENRKKLATLTREELKDLIWKIPQKHIAKKFGVLPKDIDKKCKSFKIQKPPKGYWRKYG